MISLNHELMKCMISLAHKLFQSGVEQVHVRLVCDKQIQVHGDDDLTLVHNGVIHDKL